MSIPTGEPLSYQYRAAALPASASLASVRESSVLAKAPLPAASAPVVDLTQRLGALTMRDAPNSAASAKPTKSRATRRAHMAFKATMTATGRLEINSAKSSNTPPLFSKTAPLLLVTDRPPTGAADKPSPTRPNASHSNSISLTQDESPVLPSAPAQPLPQALILPHTATGILLKPSPSSSPSTQSPSSPPHLFGTFQQPVAPNGSDIVRPSGTIAPPNLSPQAALNHIPGLGAGIDVATFISTKRREPAKAHRRGNPIKPKTFYKMNLLKVIEDNAGCCSVGSESSKYVVRQNPHDFVLDPANGDINELIIDDCDINAGTFEEFEYMGHLTRLTVKNCPQFTDAMITDRNSLLRRLKRINFSNTGITNLTLTAIHTHCQNLQTLCVANTQVSDLSALPGTGFLNSLDISYCSKIQEAQLAHLEAEKCTFLKTLIMSGCTLTDEGLQSIANTSIRTLTADRCQPRIIAESFLPTWLGGHSASRYTITLKGITALIDQQQFLKTIDLAESVTGLTDLEIRHMKARLREKVVKNDLPTEKGVKLLVADRAKSSYRHTRSRLILSESARRELLQAVQAQLQTQTGLGLVGSESAGSGSAGFLGLSTAPPSLESVLTATATQASPAAAVAPQIGGLTAANLQELQELQRLAQAEPEATGDATVKMPTDRDRDFRTG